MDWITPELFDALIIGNMLVAGALAFVRFYSDMRRPVPTPKSQAQADYMRLVNAAPDEAAYLDDTQPGPNTQQANSTQRTDQP